jgi:uncharacterized protein YkwD
MAPKPLTALSLSAVVITLLGSVAVTPAHSDSLGTAVYNGVNNLRQGTPTDVPGECGPVGSDPRLVAAAQRHANDILNNGADGHIGSDGSGPDVRMADVGLATGRWGEIVYWGTGPLGTPAAALDAWMNSPGHRAIIMNCGFTAAGFATASDGTKMVAVGDFATP